MYEFQCGSPVCKTHFTAPDKDELMRSVAEHVAKKHRVAHPSASLVRYIEQNTIREVTPSGKAARS